MSNVLKSLESRGFAEFPFHETIAHWAEAMRQAAPAQLSNSAHAHWWRHGRSWFVGVDALPNDQEGRLPGGPRLAGPVIDFLKKHLGFSGPWHAGQLSVCFPGYPLGDSDETDSQHAYRVKRDAAHVDGLHGEGPEKRRHLREQHQFILGLPLNRTDKGCAPCVVWEGSHHIMQRMFDTAFAGIAPERWGDVDVTEAYHAARKKVFDSCSRVALHAAPGEAYVIHRLALHGVAPWAEGAAAEGDARMIAYFRPLATPARTTVQSPAGSLAGHRAAHGDHR